ncbi:hypothetical protein J1614_004106 [Plenodomus biglobosus]|nr:hypothetical protein J1614_004106 [Plenodomus biglobosus]
MLLHGRLIHLSETAYYISDSKVLENREIFYKSDVARLWIHEDGSYTLDVRSIVTKLVLEKCTACCINSAPTPWLSQPHTHDPLPSITQAHYASANQNFFLFFEP